MDRAPRRWPPAVVGELLAFARERAALGGVLRTLTGLFVAIAVGLVGLLAWAFARGRAAASDVPISPVTADRFVGPDFAERRNLTTGEVVAGELDDVEALANDAFDPGRLDPAVRAFYERTGEFDLRYRATWHPPFRTGAAVATRLTRRIQQLALPGPGDESWHGLESRFLAVEEPAVERLAAEESTVEDQASEEPAADEADEPGEPSSRPSRDDVRAWVRTDPGTGEAVFVALYATHERDGERLVNIAAPLPGGNVSTVLRPELLDDGRGCDGDASGSSGLRFTTEGDGDVGLYLRTPLGAVKAPAGQEFRVWANDDGSLGAVHEMWLLGRRFLTVDYELRDREATDDEARTGDADSADDPTQTRTSTS